MLVSELIRSSNFLNSEEAYFIKGFKFQYAAEKNAKAIAKALTKAQENSGVNQVQGMEYDAKRKALQEKHCTKDENGPVALHGQYQGLAGNEEYESELKALDEEYADLLEANKKFRATDVKVKIHKVAFDDIPADLNRAQMQMLGFMLDIDL